MTNKILTIVGARPQFIKAAPMSQAFKEAGIHEIVIHTGQHFDKNMSDIFFEELSIDQPAVNLNMVGSSIGARTGKMLAALEEAMLTYKPNYVLVYGDTDSTLAGALAASKLHIPIIHIEAGLRSFNRKMPEEINRVVTDHLSSCLFAPSEIAVTNLIKEGINSEKIFQVGDIMYDAILQFQQLSDRNSSILSSLALDQGAYYLATIHRAENTDNLEKLSCIFDALNRIAHKKKCILPLHPRVRTMLSNITKTYPNITFIEPVGYLDMISLIKNAEVILTDSGGLQKEAFFLRTQCITLRNETEWIELVNMGWNVLVPPTKDLYDHVKQSIDNIKVSKKQDCNPYGIGDTAKKICQVIKAFA